MLRVVLCTKCHLSATQDRPKCRITVHCVETYRACWSQVIFKNTNKLRRSERIPVITSAQLCGAFGKKEREQRRLRDYGGGDIPPLSPVLSSYEADGPLSFCQLFLFSFCLRPRGPCSGSLTLQQPRSQASCT